MNITVHFWIWRHSIQATEMNWDILFKLLYFCCCCCSHFYFSTLYDTEMYAERFFLYFKINKTINYRKILSTNTVLSYFIQHVFHMLPSGQKPQAQLSALSERLPLYHWASFRHSESVGLTTNSHNVQASPSHPLHVDQGPILIYYTLSKFLLSPFSGSKTVV